MGRRRVFRVSDYLPSNRGHWAARLEPAPEEFVFHPHRAEGTSLWSGIHDEGVEGLRRALLHPANLELIQLLAGQPYPRLDWAMAEIGGSTEIDVAALLRDPNAGKAQLLLATCEPAGTTKPSVLRALYVRALRNSRAVLENLYLPPPDPEPTIALLAPWRGGMARPEAGHRPGWRDESLPRPEWWGYVPFRVDDAEYVLFGPWAELDGRWDLNELERRSNGWLHGEFKRTRPPNRPFRSVEFRVDLGKGSALVFLLDRGPFRARLRLLSPKHRRAMLPPGKEDFHVFRVRNIRDASYQGRWAPTGWEFVGETVEQGCPWLTWRWTKSRDSTPIDGVTASAEAEHFAITLKMFIAGT